MPRLLPTLAVLAAALTSAHAQQSTLSGPAQQLAIADALMQSAEGADDRALALSEAVRAYEAAISGLVVAAEATGAEHRRLSRALASERRDQARILGGLMRLSTVAEPMLALGDDPVTLSHAALLMDRVRATGTTRMRGIKDDLAALDQLQKLQAEQRADLIRAHKALIGAGDQLTADTAGLPDVGADAANLVALAIALDGLPEPGVATTAPETRSAPPVQGTIRQAFGPRPGITIDAAAGALVITPQAASVRFAGQMDGYGRVAIVEPAPGRLIVLAGLDRVLVQTGTNIPAGRGVGFLPGQPDLHEEFLGDTAEESGTTAIESLYMEVRVDGTPVDPALWFAFES